MPAMSSDLPAINQPRKENAEFATTQWNIVLAAGQPVEKLAAREALAQLCQSYWFPVYAYIRRRVADSNEAQDLTQAFFEHLLEKQTIAAADPDRGRFRAYLLTACKRFLINEWHKMRAAKRGGGRLFLSLDFESGDSRYRAEAVDNLTPERVFDQQWAVTLLGRVLDCLREEYDAKGKLEQFQRLKTFIAGADSEETIAAAAAELDMSPGAARVAAHRLRKRYRELLTQEISQTVRFPEDIDEEIAELFSVLGS